MSDDTSNGRRRSNLTNAQDQESNLTSVTSSVVTRREAVWTPALVEQRLRKATALKAALMEGCLDDDIAMGRRPKGIGIIGVIGSTSRERGDDSVVDMATEALTWLRWLDTDDAGIVGARLDGAPWKSICWHFGVSRPTADRRFRYALAVIAWRLNGNVGARRTPSLRSMLGLRRAA